MTAQTATIDLKSAPRVEPAVIDLWADWGIKSLDTDQAEQARQQQRYVAAVATRDAANKAYAAHVTGPAGWDDEGQRLYAEYRAAHDEVEQARRVMESALQRHAQVVFAMGTIVNALAQDDKRYAVLLDPSQATAATDLVNRKVVITAAALRDTRLPLDYRLAITTAMAVHEAGHSRISKPHSNAVQREWGNSPHYEMAHRISNVLDDVLLEREVGSVYRAYRSIFDLTLWWVATRRGFRPAFSRAPATRPEADTVMVNAVRYDRWCRWDADPALQAERRWWQAWADRWTVDLKSTTHVKGVREALDHLLALPEGQPEQPDPPQPGTDPQPGSDPESDEDDEVEMGEGEGDEDGLEPEDGDLTDVDPFGRTEGEDSSDEDTDPAPGGSNGDRPEPDEDDEPEPLGGGAFDPEGDGSYQRNETEGTGEDESSAETQPEDDDVTDGETSKGYTVHSETADAGEPSEQDADAYDGGDYSTPLHPTDTLTPDERDLDQRTARFGMDVSAGEDSETVEVQFDGDAAPHTVRITKLQSNAARIQTDPESMGALRAAFVARRTSHDSRTISRSGRLTGQRVFRAAAGFDNVFARRDQLSPDRLDVHLLVDASGSMSGYNLDMAKNLAANLSEALVSIPTARVHVWAHNTGAGTQVWDVWDSTNPAEKMARMSSIRVAGGNNDGSAIAAVTQRILAGRKAREHSILVVVSDGAPCEPVDKVASAVDHAREQRVDVVSVAISGGLTSTQEACYGPRDVVTWHGDWERLGHDMAQIIGRLA